jgi:hypothetical protein
VPEGRPSTREENLLKLSFALDTQKQKSQKNNFKRTFKRKAIEFLEIVDLKFKFEVILC